MGQGTRSAQCAGAAHDLIWACMQAPLPFPRCERGTCGSRLFQVIIPIKVFQQAVVCVLHDQTSPQCKPSEIAQVTSMVGLLLLLLLLHKNRAPAHGFRCVLLLCCVVTLYHQVKDVHNKPKDRLKGCMDGCT